MKSSMLLTVLILVLTGPATAAVYKWIDESGNVHYGDCPTSKCNGKKIDIEPGPTEEQAKETRERVKKLIEKQKLKDDIRKIELEREENRPKTRQEIRCNALKFKLNALANKDIKIYSDSPGKPREMSNKERDVMRINITTEMKKYCK